MFENKAKISALLENKDFVIEMMSQETPEAVQKVFSNHGVEVTMEEVDEIGKALANIENRTATEELNEDSLTNVSGGAALTTAAIAWGIVKVVGAVGGLGVSVYKWYKSR